MHATPGTPETASHGERTLAVVNAELMAVLNNPRYLELKEQANAEMRKPFFLQNKKILEEFHAWCEKNLQPLLTEYSILRNGPIPLAA